MLVLGAALSKFGAMEVELLGLWEAVAVPGEAAGLQSQTALTRAIAEMASPAHQAAPAIFDSSAFPPTLTRSCTAATNMTM